MNKLLYYPSILVPSAWLKRSILYSDCISTICPYNVDNFEGFEENRALADMKYLESCGQFEFSRPERLGYMEFDSILNDLTKYLSKRKLKTIREHFNNSHYSYQIYKGKMDSDIILYLIEEGVAYEDPNVCDSIFVEPGVGLLYMSLLAFYSSQVADDYDTATDKVMNFSRVFGRSNTSEDCSYYSNLLINKLPRPSSNNSLEDIIKFKEQHYQELLHFRIYLNNWVSKIQQNPTHSIINQFEDELTSYSLEIKSKNERAWT